EFRPSFTVVVTVAEGDLVWFLERVRVGNLTGLGADIFRLADRRIVEHWDEVPRGRQALPSAAARRCPGTRARERSPPAPPRQPAASGARPWAVPAHTAPVRARPYPAPANPPALGIRPGYGLWVPIISSCSTYYSGFR